MRNTGLKTAYFYSLAAVGVVAVTGIITGVLSSRILGAKGRGELTALLLLPGLIGQLGNVGILQAIGYLDSPARGRSKPVAGAGLVAAFSAGCVLYLCVIPFLGLLVPALPDQMLIPAAICLLYVPLNFVYMAMRGADIAAGRFRSFNLLHVAAGIGQVIFMLIFWGMGHATPPNFGLAVVLSVLLVLIARISTLTRTLRAARVTWNAMSEVLLKTWQFTKPELAGLALLRCDVLLLARMVPIEALGLYTVAMAIAFGQAVAANPISQVCFHSTSSAPDRITAVEALARQFRFLQILFLAMAAFAMAIAPTLIRLAFGPRFNASAPSAVILILGMAVWSSSQILEGGLRGMDLARLCSWGNLVGLGVLLGSSRWLVQAFGIEGMALAVLAGQSGSLGAKLFMMRRYTGHGIAQFWGFSRAGSGEFLALARTQLKHLTGRFAPDRLESIKSA